MIIIKALDKNEKPIGFSENLSKTNRMNEFVMMGLRLNSGFDLDEFNEKFNEELFKNLW